MSERCKVLDVGNCDPDHAGIRRLLSTFDADIERVMYVHEAVESLAKSRFDLVLVNRLVFADSSEGMGLIERMQADERWSGTPVMLISNFEEAQERAVAAGARRGFGKADLSSPATVELLGQYLKKQNAQ